MEWINLHTSTLDSEEFLGSEPVDRATWLCLLRFCCGQENGGVIRGARAWGDRRWQQVCGVTHAEVMHETELWQWHGDDLRIHSYPVDKETEVRAKRDGGRQGGMARTEAKAEAARTNGAKHRAKLNPSSNPTEGKGREGKGMEGGGSATPPPPTISQGKAIDTSALLASLGLPNAPKDVTEWRGGLAKVACCRSEPEARAFISWSVGACRLQGVAVEHWRHVRLLGIEWNDHVRDQRWGAA